MKIRNLNRSCPICRNLTGDVLHTQKFVFASIHFMPGEYDVVSCCHCGFVYADISLKQDDFDAYYASMSKYEMTYIPGNSHIYKDRAKWVSSVICDVSANIIDIGSGNSSLLYELQGLGFFNLTALDPSEKCIANACEKGIVGVTLSIFDLSVDKKYDVAIMSGVLEHIYELPGIMKRLQSLIRRNGFFLVCVPDASRYHQFDSIPFDYFNCEHVNHFDETSLINLGLAYGFRVVNLVKTTVKFSNVEQPMIFCAYSNECAEASEWRNHSAKMLSQYVSQTSQIHNVDVIIDRLAQSQEEIIVWGAGNYASRLLATSRLNQCKIVMFVDNDKHKQGGYLFGKQICSPMEIINKHHLPVIIIAVAVFSDDILKEISLMGVKNKVVVLK
ncbi:MAG: methyltransferase domain-containing protein [Candidatus Omnitrophica bacterium]|nr:methyltransferase domain-containing protein [Candidatus Omnitrophota bacterium]